MATTDRRIFHDADAASINSLVMTATVAGWVGSFFLMANDEIAAEIFGVLLCAQTMIWAAYLLHEAAHGVAEAGNEYLFGLVEGKRP